jgi:5-carboxymethyl-2-hydroxymuconate isomerase
MPHLRLETTAEPDDRRGFAAWVTERFSDVMETGTGHVGVSIHVRDETELALGRASDGGEVVLVDADIRAGRSEEQRREFAASIIESVSERWDVPEANVYLVYTEHAGRDFHLAEGALASWDETESEIGAGRREE